MVMPILIRFRERSHDGSHIKRIAEVPSDPAFDGIDGVRRRLPLQADSCMMWRVLVSWRPSRIGLRLAFNLPSCSFR